MVMLWEDLRLEAGKGMGNIKSGRWEGNGGN